MHQEEKKYGVFISYSHEDAKFVSPIVSLISSMRQDLVFSGYKKSQARQEMGAPVIKSFG
jgi:hypothetical protein